MEQDVIDLEYRRLEQAELANQPFRHILVPGFVPPARLDAVTQDLPPLTKGGSYPIDSLQLGPNARGLMQDLQGERFRAIIASRLELNLAGAPTMVTLRGQSREKDGRIHRDSDAKRVTVLLYLNPRSASWSRQDGCLRLLRGPKDLEDFAVEVPPVDGALLVFPNGPGTWHGHKPFVGRRYVVQLNYMMNDAAARSELRRHRLSAAVKRLVAA